MIGEVGIAALLGLLAGLGLWLALAKREARLPPLIAASVKALRPGLYQVDIGISNRAPHALAGEWLRRVRPSSAKLLAPIKQVSTKEGDFQVWSDPEGDAPAAKIAVDLLLGPRLPQGGVATLSAEGTIAVWLFLRREKDLARLELELALREEGGKLSRHRFGVTPPGA